MRATSERAVPPAPLIPENESLTGVPAPPLDLGDGTHVVVARGTTLFSDVQHKKPVFSIANKENVVFRRGQVIGDSVELLSANAQEGTCHRDLDGLGDHDLRFWVSAGDLVGVTTKDTDLGLHGVWKLTAHPGAEVVEGYVVYNSFRAPAASALLGLSFTPQTPEGAWISIPDADLETPIPVGELSTSWDQKNGKSTYLMLPHAKWSETLVSIDEACFTLSRTLQEDSPKDRQLAAVGAVGGLFGDLLSNSGANPIQIAKGAGISWQDESPAGRTVRDIWVKDSWRADGKVCGKISLPADANVASDSVVLCYDEASVIP